MRLFALLVLLVGAGVRAAGWEEIDPGTSSKEDVIRKFGAPSKELTSGNMQTLGYTGARLPPGVLQVQFRTDPRSGLVTRVDVFPRATMDARMVESTYGPRCGNERGGQAHCHLRKVGSDQRIQWRYERRAMVVFFKPDGETVFALTFYGEQQRVQARAKEAEDQGPGGEQSGSHGQASSSEDEYFAEISDDSIQEALAENKLEIGGQFVFRGALGLASRSTAPVRCCELRQLGAHWQAPLLADTFFDARPNKRLRGMLRARLRFDPVQSPEAPAARGPTVDLDQFWAKFDLFHLLYVTAGRQQVKWGTSKIWTPTDYLARAYRDPLSAFDERLGSDLLKLHLPWPRLGWNFYAIGFLKPARAALTEVEPGGAVRAELVAGTAELGLGATFQRRVKPKLAADLSLGLGPLDLYGELALRRDLDYRLWEREEGGFVERVPRGQLWAASGGISLPLRVARRDLTLGGETYFQSWGYTDREILPWLVRDGSYVPLYFARHYVAGYASLTTSDSPGAAVLSATAIGNLSDRTWITRLQALINPWSSVTVELFAEVPLGPAGGEYRFAADLGPDGPFLPMPLFRVGAGLVFAI